LQSVEFITLEIIGKVVNIDINDDLVMVAGEGKRRWALFNPNHLGNLDGWVVSQSV